MTGTEKTDVAGALFNAVDRNDMEKVKTIVESGRVLSLATFTRGFYEKKETLAQVAARRGNLDMVKYLLEKDSLFLELDSFPDRYLRRPNLLQTAVKYGHLDIVKYLVESHDEDIFRAHFPDQSPVILAISAGHLHIVRYFIEERCVDPNTGGPQKTESYYHNSNSLLFPAIASKRDDITMYLIDEVNANLTALHYEDDRNILYGAQFHNNLNLMKYVLDVKKAPIDINWRDKDGQTLLFSAVENSHRDILEYLVEQKKADVNIPSYKRATPLHGAVSRRPEIFKYLIDHGAHIDARNTDGNTPLHLTAKSGRVSRDLHCKYLLERGANVKLKNIHGRTPLDLAMDSQFRFDVSKCLIDHSVDINRTVDDGGTLVHKVVIRNQIVLLQYLVEEKHADINIARKKDKWTPLHCAARQDHPEICKYLIEHGADPRAKDINGRSPAEVAIEETIIDYIQNATTEVRSRRSVLDHSSIWMPVHQPKHENHERQVTGNSCKKTIALTGEMNTFHFHGILIFTNFAARYFYRPPILVPRIPEISLNRVNHEAEDAINTFMDFEGDETS